ncbi:transposase [Ornithobacterium rhinotracheale]
MKANVKKIRKIRRFSEEFKKQLVSEYESGKYSVMDLVKLHSISSSNIYNWIYKYSQYNEKGYRMVEHTESSSKKIKELEEKIKSLEAIVGKKQIQIDFLETMIEVAKDELNIDIKKNYSTPPSNVSENVKKKRVLNECLI